MKIFKIQAAILALILFTLPMLNIQEANAFGIETTVTKGKTAVLERPKLVGHGDNVTFTAKFTGTTGYSSIQWVWDICGTKQTISNKANFNEKTVKMNKAGNCKVTVDVIPFYTSAIPERLTDNVTVLPVTIVPVTLSGPASVAVNNTVSLTASHNQPVSFKGSKTVWDWKPGGVCTGTKYETGGKTSTSGEIPTKKGTCTKTVTMNIYETGYILRGTATKSVTIN